MESEQWFLRDLRKELRLNQDDISPTLTANQISNYELGKEIPTDEERRALVDGMVRRAAVRGLEILILERR